MNDLQKARRPAGEPGDAGGLFGAGAQPQATVTVSILHDGARAVKLWAKGLCEPVNPAGWACWGWHAVDAAGRRVAADAGCLGYGAGMTANRAAYRAAIEALTWCAQAGARGVILYCDNKLVVEQAMDRWACHSPALLPLLAELRSWMAETGALLEWIGKDRNKVADQLARNSYGNVSRDAQRRIKTEGRAL